MVAKISEGEWTPLPGAQPEDVSVDTVYVLPTHRPPDNDTDGMPRYADYVRYLPKEARAAGLPVAFATPENRRKYLQHFSIGPEMWVLGLTLFSVANSWLILTVELFIHSRAKAQGWTQEESLALPLKVSVAETSTSRNIEVEGSGTDVLDALRILHPQAIEEGESGRG